MKRITAVVGDFYHSADEAGEALQQAIATWAGASDVSLRFVEAGRLKEELGEKPDAVVLFKEDRAAPQEDGSARWMTPEIASAIVDYVQQGGGWMAWHSGLASYDPDGPYVEMLRGYFLHHPEQHQPVRYTPAGEGFGGETQEFEVLDEHYFVEYDSARTETFLRSESVDGSSVAGWRHTFGAGRVCCLTPAHRREGLLQPDFQRLLGEAVRWCCG